jgi:uncharacterized protein YfkK (UPF0435 family)
MQLDTPSSETLLQRVEMLDKKLEIMTNLCVAQADMLQTMQLVVDQQLTHMTTLSEQYKHIALTHNENVAWLFQFCLMMGFKR